MISGLATSSPGTTVHAAQAGTTVGSVDEIYVYGINPTGTDQDFTVEFGGTGATFELVVTVPAKSIVMLIPGLPLQNGLLAKVFAPASMLINGFVNRLTA